MFHHSLRSFFLWKRDCGDHRKTHAIKEFDVHYWIICRSTASAFSTNFQTSDSIRKLIILLQLHREWYWKLLYFHRSGSSKKIHVEYRLARNFSEYQWLTTFNTFEAFGADGYIFLYTFMTTAKDGSNTSSGIFLNIDHSKSSYQYKLDAGPPSTNLFLKQLNARGDAGYRLKVFLDNGTQSFTVYVRDTSRPTAKYIYRWAHCVSNLAELFVQMNRYGAQGYRQFGSFAIDGLCMLYIKDTSKKSKFVYEMVPDFNNTDDFLAKSNELGAQRLSYSSVSLQAYFVSNGTICNPANTPLLSRYNTEGLHFLLYICTSAYCRLTSSSPCCKNKKQKVPSSPGVVRASTGLVLTFVKIRNCQYKSINVDGLLLDSNPSLTLTQFLIFFLSLTLAHPYSLSLFLSLNVTHFFFHSVSHFFLSRTLPLIILPIFSRTTINFTFHEFDYFFCSCLIDALSSDLNHH